MSSNGWWFETPREQHVEATRADMVSRCRRSEDWIAAHYTSAEVAYLIGAGYVDGWPLEFTRKGRDWHYSRGITPPISNLFWKKVHDR